MFICYGWMRPVAVYKMMFVNCVIILGMYSELDQVEIGSNARTFSLKFLINIYQGLTL